MRFVLLKEMSHGVKVVAEMPKSWLISPLNLVILFKTLIRYGILASVAGPRHDQEPHMLQ